jgi:arylsulfatase A-like enzyme/tetratricopeptide (TPR) repeat protein
VILFFVDTLRADRLHCAGYGRELTPNIDALASEGTRFSAAVTQAPWSLPSYASTFTSVYPPVHGIEHDGQTVKPGLPGLPSLLAAQGYRTAAFVGGMHLRRQFGLSAGFEVYRDWPDYGSFQRTVPQALRWLDRQAWSPFFLMVHSYDVHAPYSTPFELAELLDPGYEGVVHSTDVLNGERLLAIVENRFIPDQAAYWTLPRNLREFSQGVVGLPSVLRTFPFLLKPLVPGGPPAAKGSQPSTFLLSEADTRHIRAHYDAAVWYADTWLGLFREALERRGLLENTVFVLASDHGEELGEHGSYGHGRELTQASLRVPLIVSGPGIARSRMVTEVVELIDLAPTVLELCKLPAPDSFQGRSLVPHLTEAVAPPADPLRAAFSFCLYRRSIQTSRWHLFTWPSGRTSLYDLQTDPGETHDVSSAQPQVRRWLESRLHECSARPRSDSRTTAPGALASSGASAGSTSPPALGPPSGAEAEALETAPVSLFSAGVPRAASRLFRALDTDSDGRLTQVDELSRIRSKRDAPVDLDGDGCVSEPEFAESLVRLVRLSPGLASVASDALLAKGDALMAAGKPQEALESFLQAEGRAPNPTRVAPRKALALKALGRLLDARDCLAAALAISQPTSDLCLTLAPLEQLAGDPDRAEKLTWMGLRYLEDEAQRAQTALDPEPVRVLLESLAGEAGRPRLAVEVGRWAVARLGLRHPVAQAWALAMLRFNRLDEGLAELARQPRPDYGVLDAMALLLEEKGKAREAAVTCRRALAVPGEPRDRWTTRLRLVRCLASAGELEQAREELATLPLLGLSPALKVELARVCLDAQEEPRARRLVAELESEGLPVPAELRARLAGEPSR